MGDVHPLGNPHYWLDPENGRRIAKAVQAKLSQKDPANAAYYAQRAADFDRRLSRGAAALEVDDGALQGHQGRHLSPLVGQLRRCVRHRRDRLRRAQAGHPADAAAHARRHPGDARAGDQADHRRALLRLEDAELDRVADRRPRCWCCRRRSAACRPPATTSSCSTPTSTCWSARSSPPEPGTMELPIDRQVPGGALRRQPDPHRHPRLSGCPRRRAGGHLRRPLARADRRARRDDRAAHAAVRTAIRTRRRSTGSAWRSRSSAPGSSR